MSCWAHLPKHRGIKPPLSSPSVKGPMRSSPSKRVSKDKAVRGLMPSEDRLTAYSICWIRQGEMQRRKPTSKRWRRRIRKSLRGRLRMLPSWRAGISCPRPSARLRTPSSSRMETIGCGWWDGWPGSKKHSARRNRPKHCSRAPLRRHRCPTIQPCAPIVMFNSSSRLCVSWSRPDTQSDIQSDIQPDTHCSHPRSPM